MEFALTRPIYLQIADYCHGRIMAGEWVEDQRIPSVRELAVKMSVNTHTVLKALEQLQADGIIEPRRGLGYFLAPNARERVSEAKRREFFESYLPELRQRMSQLGITLDDLIAHLSPR